MPYFFGTSASETITGTDGADIIVAVEGDDHLIGLGGADRLIGGAGADILEGGDGDDIYHADALDTIIESAGQDEIVAGHSVDLEDYPEVENLSMSWNLSNRQFSGNSMANVITDLDGSNRLDGRAGDDALLANGGNDILIGGLGVDTLTGGPGSDRFDFLDVGETGVGEAERDVIGDFASVDSIHLGQIDADTAHSGNQVFRFLGATDFTGTAGELVTYQQTVNGEPATVLAGDVNGDGLADFEIELRGQHTLTAGDFIL